MFGGKTAIISTENSIRKTRLKQICHQTKLPWEKVEKNLFLYCPVDVDEQISLVKSIREHDKALPFNLLIIDSIIYHFRTRYSGRKELPKRFSKLMNHLGDLKYIAQTKNIFLVFTNQVWKNGGDNEKALGGHAMAHFSDMRIKIMELPTDERLATVIASPHLPESSAKFSINHTGLTN